MLGSSGRFWYATADERDLIPTEIGGDGFWRSTQYASPETEVAAVCVSLVEPTAAPTRTFEPTAEPLTAKDDDEIKAAAAAVEDGGTILLTSEIITLTKMQFQEDGLGWVAGVHFPW